MKSEEIANFLGIDIGAVEFILSNSDIFSAYVDKNLRFDVKKPSCWTINLFLWNEWNSLFDIPIGFDLDFYWVSQLDKPLVGNDWAEFLFRYIIILNKIPLSYFSNEIRHEILKKFEKIISYSVFLTNDLFLLRLFNEVCFPINSDLSWKWYEFSRKFILSSDDLSELKRSYWNITRDLTPLFLQKIVDTAEVDLHASELNNLTREERIEYQNSFVDSIIGDILTLKTPLEVEKKLSSVHPLLRAVAIRRWLEEKILSLKSPLEAKNLFLSCFRKNDEELVLNKWKEISREAILFLSNKFDAIKLYPDCHPDLRSAIVIFLSGI